MKSSIKRMKKDKFRIWEGSHNLLSYIFLLLTLKWIVMLLLDRQEGTLMNRNMDTSWISNLLLFAHVGSTTLLVDEYACSKQ